MTVLFVTAGGELPGQVAPTQDVALFIASAAVIVVAVILFVVWARKTRR